MSGDRAEGLPARRANILDVARKAGVSRTTVSRVLNGSTDVTPDTVAKVRSAMDELNYAVNPLAKALRRGRPDIITLVTGHLGLPFTAEFATILSRLASTRGYMVSLVTVGGDMDDLGWVLRQLTPSVTSGVVIAVPGNVDTPDIRTRVAELMESGVRTVISGSPMLDPPAPVFVIDYPGAVARATRAALDGGASEVLLVAASHDTAQADELRGAYSAIMTSRGLDPVVVESSLDASGGTTGELARLLRRRCPDAVVTRSVRLAVATAAAVADLAPAHRVRVLCCSDAPLLDVIRPPIDSSHVDIDAYSSAILDALLTTTPTSGRIIPVDTTLVIRSR